MVTEPADDKRQRAGKQVRGAQACAIEAEEKLNAITSIERSIREQADAAGQQ